MAEKKIFCGGGEILLREKWARPIVLRERGCLIDEHVYAVYVISELSTRMDSIPAVQSHASTRITMLIFFMVISSGQEPKERLHTCILVVHK